MYSKPSIPGTEHGVETYKTCYDQHQQKTKGKYILSIRFIIGSFFPRYFNIFKLLKIGMLYLSFDTKLHRETFFVHSVVALEIARCVDLYYDSV